MTKIRVHELAKEFGVPSKEMAARIKDLGYNIKNYMSTLEDYEADEIRKRLRGQSEEKAQEKAETAKARKVIRRRHQVIRIKKIVRRRPPAPEAVEEEKAPAETPVSSGSSVEESVAPSEKEQIKEQVEAVEQAEQEAEKEKKTQGEKAVPAAEEVPGVPVSEEVVSAAPAEEKTDEVSVEEKAPVTKETGEKTSGKKPERPEPKRFVKILDRPRIEIPVRPKTAPKVRKPRREVEAKARMEEPKAPTTPEAMAPAPEKKPKKKGKRVVQMTGMRDAAKKRKVAPKRRKDRNKPIVKVLAEEADLIPDKLAAEEPSSAESVLAPPSHRRKKRHEKGAAKAEKAVTAAPPAPGKRKFAVYETIQVGELAKRMGVKVADVIMKLMSMGMMTTANQTVDYETAALIGSEFGYEVEKKAVAEDLLTMEDVKGGEPVPRPPVVTVMGHVDHGKTSLLDAIRQADVVSGEAGGITQHIGAYQVKLPSGNEVVFLDTPGHEAFTAMRARGTQVTDIVILVVAADDGVMAQTREAIDHSRAAGVPIIVAVNKIDKPGANPERVKSELAELGLIPEDWGGDTIFVEVSAKKKIGIEDLLEMLILQAEVMELKADPDRPARGHVVEAKLDKGRGPVATLLISEGTLRVGDAMVCGLHYGKVRAMLDDRGRRINSAGPSMPVEIQGLSGVPEAGNEFVVLSDEKKAREVADYRQRKARESELAKRSRVSLESVFEKLQEGEVKELNVVLKTDVQGSMEALSDALTKLSTRDVRVNIVRAGIGAVTESDVLLASASDAIIIGFNVRPSPQAKAVAELERVDIRFYDVIYNALDEVKSAMVGMLEPEYREKILGQAEVRATFRIPKVGAIAGSYVTQGLIRRNANVRLLRDNVVVYTGKISSLRRFKEDVREVQTGYECGIGLDKFNDIKEGDVIEAYVMEEVTPELGKALSESRDNDEGQDTRD